jgi:glutamate/tyrosine decarboxylase-like PLP-dependent enzyme
MLTRRNFLSFTSAGALALAAECRPADSGWMENMRQGCGDATRSLLKLEKLAAFKSNLLGFPVNMNTPSEEFFAWRRRLNKSGVGEFAYNNVGDPFRESPIPYNTHDLERAVALKFGQLYGFDPHNIWGFLSNSGTDSNMHGMYIGRTILAARNRIFPRCYFTREAHYSIQILRDLLGLETVLVATTPDGAMDAEDLARKLAENAERPALVVATVGTTFKGAVDDVDCIQEALRGYSSYLHVDAALFGGYLPHTAFSKAVLQQGPNGPASKRYDSIAVSCHKFFGFPAPAGIFVTTRANFDEFHEYYSKVHGPEYIGHVPGTITCSRDSVKPAEFYYFTTASSLARQADDARLILGNAKYLFDQMRSRLPHLAPVRANELSNTIYFRRPDDAIKKKYSLAAMKITVNGKEEDYAHVVVMPHASRKVLDNFLTDLDADSTVRL